MRSLLAPAGSLLLIACVAAAHPGRVDPAGCHRNQKGASHCHEAAETLAFVAKLPAARTARVSRIIDGDTIEVNGGQTIRLIGVDTPETKHPRKPIERFGREAWMFTRRIAQGRTVRLEFDQANASVKHRDRYGRMLAYAFLPDGALVNLEIIRQGYGFAYTRFPFSRVEEFRAAERDARRHGRGLWAP